MFKLIMLIGMLSFTAGPTPNTAEKEIKGLISSLAKGETAQSVDQLSPLLGNDFRVVFQDVAKGEVNIIDRASYLDFIQKKIFGGYPTEVTVHDIDVQGDLMAVAKVSFKGPAFTIHRYQSFVKHEGKWLLVEDLAYMQK